MAVITSSNASYGLHRVAVNTLKAEYWKLRSIQSTLWTLTAVVVGNVGVAILLAIFVSGRLSTSEKSSVDVVRLSLGGLHISQIAMGVLGVLIVSSEYSSGMIRATLAAMPRRRLVLVAKMIVLAVVSLIAGIASCFAAFFAFEALRVGNGMSATFSDPGVLRAVIGGGLYLGVVGLFGMGLAAIIRNPGGSIAALLGLLFVPGLLINLLPGSWQPSINPYLPLNAGEVIYIASRFDPHTLAPWTGFGLLCAYTAAALAVGIYLINHRDA
jgi:ABC-2 type transport system permease protein